MAELRETFVERAWVAIRVIALIMATIVPTRSLLLGTWSLTDMLILALSGAWLALYPFRRQLPVRARPACAILFLMLGGIIATLGNGLQGSGVTCLLLANLLVAMLYDSRVLLATVAVTILTAIAAGAGYATGALSLRFGETYLASPVAWAYTLCTLVAGSFALLACARQYWLELQVLMAQITAQRDEIARLADHDMLTGLPVFRLGRDRFETACARARRTHQRVALLFVDLDDFKKANDRFGHEAGDAVLKAEATRLQACVRASDAVARRGGDEFLVILTDVTAPSAAEHVADKIIAAIRRPVDYLGQHIFVGASVGIAIFPEDSAEPETLLRFADQAMYAAKKGGKNQYMRHITAPPPPQVCVGVAVDCQP
jgi:diguanylate cyclase (GGDEF)-like protein